jgi:nitroreductase
MELLEVIKQRRSVRKFTNQDVPQEALDQILDAVRWAPSWANTQCWEVVVVKDPSVKTRLQAAVSEGNPGYKALAEAPVLLVLCAQLKRAGHYKGAVTTKFGDWFLFDLGIIAQNIMLMAHTLGLGTVVVGMFDHDKAKTAIGVPEGYELAALMPLGHPESQPSAPKRREISEFMHLETF